jgi:hypothetical protein
MPTVSGDKNILFKTVTCGFLEIYFGDTSDEG